jgi:hypothetical protein
VETVEHFPRQLAAAAVLVQLVQTSAVQLVVLVELAHQHIHHGALQLLLAKT